MEKRILDILANVNEELLTYIGPSMVEDGLVDSFELISIIGKLEDEFNIEINAEELTGENFGNKDRIIAMMKRVTNS